MEDSARDNPEALSTEVDKTPMDSQNKDVVEDVEHASTTQDKVAVQAVREDPASPPMMNIPRPTPFETVDVPELVLLHATPVHGGAVPNGYLGPFLSLESQLHAAAGRVDRRNAATTNVFSRSTAPQSKKAKRGRGSTDRTHCSGPTGGSIRVKTEKVQRTRFRSRVRLRGKTQRPRERNKWLDVFALLASSTPTSALLRDDRSSRKLLGAGRRAGTMRARVRSIQKILRWLATAHAIPYRTSHMHMAEFLQVRHSEPCPRGAITLSHAAFVFMEELAGVSEHFSSKPLYVSIKKELMATSLGSQGKQTSSEVSCGHTRGSRRALDRSCSTGLFPDHGMVATPPVVGTPRFADHRGLEPRNIHVEGGSLIAKLTRSKTLGMAKPAS